MRIPAWFTFLMKSEPPKTSKRTNNMWIIDESKCFSANEVHKLRALAGVRRESGLTKRRFDLIRDWFMVELGLQAGLRVSEMASLRHSDLFLDEDRSSISVLGKGRKRRPVWIGSAFKAICLAYLKDKLQFGFRADPESYLLNHLRDGNLTKRTLQKRFTQLLKEAGLPSYYYIHCLRHTYTTFLLRASNNNYRFAQKQLGHASIRTTQVYAGIVETDVRIALERMYR